MPIGCKPEKVRGVRRWPCAAFSIADMSSSRRKEQAASRRSVVRRLMTPMVRWRAPTGRIAFAGMASSAETLGEVTTEVKRWREAWNWDFDEGVMSGRQRKWVSWGFGGIGGFEEGEAVWKALVKSSYIEGDLLDVRC